MLSFWVSKYLTESRYKRELGAQTQIIKDRANKLSSDAVNILASLGVYSGPECSPEQVKLFQKVVFKTNGAHIVGLMSDNDELVCSSLGVHKPALKVFSIQQTTNRGINVYLKAIVANIGDDLTYVKKGNLVIFFRNSTIIDFPKLLPSAVVSVIYHHSNNVLVSDGFINMTWMKTIQDKAETYFYADSYFIASRLSYDGTLQYIVAIPQSVISDEYLLLFFKTSPIAALLILSSWLSYIFWLRSNNTILAKLKKTLDDEIDLYLEYQPVIDLKTGKCVGAEALLRWKNEDGEMISPAVFVPIAEQHGIMPSLTVRVTKLLEQDCSELFKKYPDFHIAINISSQDLQSKKVQDAFLSLLASLNTKPKNFIAEVTERELLNSVATRKAFSKIRKLGSTIAIDDFGTGYSSLSYLGDFEIDYLKIDKSFIDTIGTDAPTSKVAVHIIGIAKSLHLEMIAEGVETKEQEKYLREHNVQFAQGWLYSKSLRIHNLMRYLEHHH